MIRVLHLITSLEVGGAEATLVKLAQSIDKKRFHFTVVCMTSDASQPPPLAAPLIEAGIPVHFLNMRRSTLSLFSIWRLIRIINQERPDVMQSWLYHADLMGLVVHKLARAKHLAWNIRCSNIDLRKYHKLTSFVLWLLARFSHIPDVVVANSLAGQKTHSFLGYTPKRWQVIENGIDVDRFTPASETRDAVRQQWNIAPDTPLVGVPARYDPMKGHAVLLQAIKLVQKSIPGARFVLMGDGTKTVRKKGVISLDRRLDMERLYPAFNVVCLPSTFGEGFPNVIGEAMACGVPVVATDVGDAARIVGDTGWVVEPGDAEKLAAALIEALSTDTAQRSTDARARIVERFTQDRMVAAYDALYSDLAGQ